MSDSKCECCKDSLEEESEPNKIRMLVVGALTTVCLMWVGSWFMLTVWFKSGSERAQFGDMFGGLNTLFSGLAFAGVVLTIYLQTRELRAQREDLKMTRDEIRQSRKAQERSADEAGKSSKISLLQIEVDLIRADGTILAQELAAWNVPHNLDKVALTTIHGGSPDPEKTSKALKLFSENRDRAFKKLTDLQTEGLE